jgi:hypothetical protein
MPILNAFGVLDIEGNSSFSHNLQFQLVLDVAPTAPVTLTY